MNLAHFGHSCVLIETASDRLLLDPGTLSVGYEQVRDLTAVLITHQHPDHLDPERLPGLLAANPRAELVVDEGSAPVVAAMRLSAPARVLRAGEQLLLGATPVAAVGGEHAVIHADIARIANVGYVIEDGAFFHPGDSFVTPPQDIDVLAVPASAPWLKVSEAVDFLRAVAPRVALPIHEAMLASTQLTYGLLTNLAPEGTQVVVPPRGETVPV